MYKKILLVTGSSFNYKTGTGVTISNLFRNYPNTQLAIIHNDKYPNNSKICKRSFKLSNDEFKSLITKSNNINKSINKAKIESSLKFYLKKKIKSFFISFFGETDFINSYYLSKNLISFIDDFRPDYIYGHYSSIETLDFLECIIDYTQKPYVLHFMDDFYHFRYRKGLFSLFRKKIWIKKNNNMIKKSYKSIAISNKMMKEYSKIFSFNFLSFYNTINFDEWKKIKGVKPDDNEFKVFYSGTINAKNEKTLMEFSNIINDLNENLTINLKFHIYTTSDKLNYYSKIIKNNSTYFFGPIDNSKFIKTIKSYNLLFLSVDFNHYSYTSTRLSMFTKLAAYLSSSIPILFWAPRTIASSEYLIDNNLAFVETNFNNEKLKEKINFIINNPEKNEIIVNNALADSKKIIQQII